MWELVSFMLGLAVFLFIINYLFEPKKLLEDIKEFKDPSSKYDLLEQRVAELERIVAEQNKLQPCSNSSFSKS